MKKKDAVATEAADTEPAAVDKEEDDLDDILNDLDDDDEKEDEAAAAAAAAEDKEEEDQEDVLEDHGLQLYDRSPAPQHHLLQRASRLRDTPGLTRVPLSSMTTDPCDTILHCRIV